MSQFDAILQQKIMNCEMPTFGYRRGAGGEIEKDVFDGVIPKGWADSPARVDDATALEAEIETEPASGAEEEERTALVAPYGNYTYRELSAELKARTGIGARPSENVDALVTRLNEFDATERAANRPDL